MWAYCVPLLCCFCDACAAPLQLVMDAFPSFLVFKVYRRSLVHAAVSRRNQGEEQVCVFVVASPYSFTSSFGV